MSAPEPDALWVGLCGLVRHGARAAALAAHAPDVVDLLVPAGPDGVPVAARAVEAEELLRRAAGRLEAPADQAVPVLLGLAAGTCSLGLAARRRRAARLLGISPETLRAPEQEGALMWDLMAELLRLKAAGE